MERFLPTFYNNTKQFSSLYISLAPPHLDRLRQLSFDSHIVDYHPLSLALTGGSAACLWQLDRARSNLVAVALVLPIQRFVPSPWTLP